MVYVCARIHIYAKLLFELYTFRFITKSQSKCYGSRSIYYNSYSWFFYRSSKLTSINYWKSFFSENKLHFHSECMYMYGCIMYMLRPNLYYKWNFSISPTDGKRFATNNGIITQVKIETHWLYHIKNHLFLAF